MTELPSAPQPLGRSMLSCVCLNPFLFHFFLSVWPFVCCTSVCVCRSIFLHDKYLVKAFSALVRSLLCNVFLKNGPFLASFLFSSFQYTVDTKQMFNNYINFCRWLDLNCGPLVSEATALPTEPQPLPLLCNVYITFWWERWTLDR